LATAGSLLGGFGAVVGASCCVLPLLLFNVGVGSAVIAQLGFFARHRDMLFGCALALLAIGILAAFWRGRKPSRRMVLSFIVAAVLIGGSYVLPFYEPELLRFFGLRE
jgi:mercuric ion transport protein